MSTRYMPAWETFNFKVLEPQKQGMGIQRPSQNECVPTHNVFHGEMKPWKGFRC